ncbi:MAG TPA: S46 family peptidase, partial [Flavitalea sp.]|nr:S46 family peptidase [Flavitalea sp.]
IPSAGLYAEFLTSIDDVTAQVMDSIKDLNGADRANRLSAVLSSINASKSNPEEGVYARAIAFFKGNQFLLFTYNRYSDIRLVGAPPESIGKYGGDTDNWEWPRHTGDFSIFRVYMSKDGKSAPYSTENIPLKPKYFLPVSIKGLKDGDYAMIYGYPGSTNRYESSYGIKAKTDILDPAIASLRETRLKFMMQEMRKDPATRLTMASEYANIANYWKFYGGEGQLLTKYDIEGQKKKTEQQFTDWAKGKPQYENLFKDWGDIYTKYGMYNKHQVYLNEGIFGSWLIAFAGSLQQVENALVKSGKSSDINAAMQSADLKRSGFLKTENKIADQNILAAMLYRFYTDIDKSQHPVGFYEALRGSFGDLNDEATYKKFAGQVFANTMILNDSKWSSFKQNPDATILQADPAFSVASAFLKNWQGKYLPMVQQFNVANNDFSRNYMKAIFEKDSAKASKMYPDANFTMRVSYGNVKSYVPRDAVKYDYVTTMRGILEKYKPGDYEFDLPAKLIELAKKKDFGQYIDKQRNDLVVGFITTNDITGGNSGSPVLDANGNLIGLCFDGNYEALSHKLAFDKDLNRTICLDVRYLLWCVDKLGEAGNLIKELKLVK